MSEDKIKQTPQMPPEHRNVKTVYDSYQEHKYNDWAKKITDSKQRYTISGQANPDPSKKDDYVVTENGGKPTVATGVEQTAFEKYLAKANANGFKVIYYDDTYKKDLDIFKSYANQLRQTFKIKSSDMANIEVGDSVLLYIVSEKINDYENMTMTIYGKVLEKDTSNNRVVLKTDGWSTGHKPQQTMIVKYDGNTDTFENLKNKASGKDAINFIIKDPKTIGLLEKNAGHTSYDNIIFQIPAEKISDKNFPMTIYGQFQRWNGLTNQLYINPKGYSTGSDEGTAPIPVPPSPGGGGRPVIVIPPDTNLTTIKGKYGFNLFNYRDLTTDNKIGLNSKTFYTKEPLHVENTDNTRKHVRIRENDDINFKYRYLSTDAKQGNIKFIIYPTPSRGSNIELNYENSRPLGTEITKKVTPNKYTYASYKLGNDQVQHWSNASVEIKGWYGDIEPNGLDQSFVFSSYNGVPLMALQTYNPVNGAKSTLLQDEYKINLRTTKLMKKVNVFKLKDADTYKINKDPNGYLLLIPAPDDCKANTKNVMSNNLCDITENEADQSLPEEKRPFLVREITQDTFPTVVNNLITGRPEYVQAQRNCFVIMLSEKNLSEWRYLLEKTQIAYEIEDKYQHDVQLPVGGQTYVLSNGSNIDTCMYGTVKAGDKQAGSNKYVVHFEDSPFGCPDIRVMVDEIVEVIDNTGFDQAP